MITWYQTIPDLNIKGKFNTPEEFDKIGLPADLTGKKFLDIGCNSGAYMIEAEKRGAMWVQGIEPNIEWRIIAKGIFAELDLDDRLSVFYDISEVAKTGFDIVLLLSVLHLVENRQQLFDKAYELTNELLIVEVNDRLQTKPVELPREAVLYGKSKDDRSVYHITKNSK